MEFSRSFTQKEQAGVRASKIGDARAPWDRACCPSAITSPREWNAEATLDMANRSDGILLRHDNSCQQTTGVAGQTALRLPESMSTTLKPESLTYFTHFLRTQHFSLAIRPDHPFSSSDRINIFSAASHTKSSVNERQFDHTVSHSLGLSQSNSREIEPDIHSAHRTALSWFRRRFSKHLQSTSIELPTVHPIHSNSFTECHGDSLEQWHLSPTHADRARSSLQRPRSRDSETCSIVRRRLFCPSGSNLPSWAFRESFETRSMESFFPAQTVRKTLCLLLTAADTPSVTMAREQPPAS